MISVLVHYQELQEAPHALIDETYVNRSKAVEIEALTKLNEMFPKMTNIKILLP